MAAEIKQFPGVEFIDQGAHEQPQEDVIRALEEMLELAESGELQAVAIAGILSDSTTINDYSPGNGPNRHSLIAAVVRMQHRILNEFDAEEDEENEETGC